MAPFHIEATTIEVVFLGPALRATRVDAGFGHVSSLSRHSRCAKLVGRELAELLEALDDHVLYENCVLFPYLRGQVSALAPALDDAREELV